MTRVLAGLLVAAGALAQSGPRMPMLALDADSAEAAGLKKKVLDARVLDDWKDAGRWTFRGLGRAEFAGQARVELELQGVKLSGWGAPAAALTRAFAGEDWTRYNRLAFRVRPRMTGFQTMTMTVALRNDGQEKVPDVYQREGAHYMTFVNNRWTEVRWEIENLARDKVTSLGFRYFVPKIIAAPGDQVSFEIGAVRLERVEADAYEGWAVGPGRISYSHSGYRTEASKTALASGLGAKEFTVSDAASGAPVLKKAARAVKTRLGAFEEMDFSELRQPGRYTLSAGGVKTRPFRIGADVWKNSIWKTINFFYGERCGMAIEGIHEACHRDWLAVVGDKKIVMNGGWHDAGDLSQGLINTGEATYAMFALAAKLQARGADPALTGRLIEEGKWGLDWVMKVRFPGGFRMGFASMNIWTNGIIGDEDDRIRAALNNPNVNYLAASAEAAAYRVLKGAEPQLAARALTTAEQDWEYAIAGQETPENLHTPAFAATEMEMAAVGTLASLELLAATGKARYAEKARELARVVLDSQQRSYVGREFPLAGFFYTSPAKTGIFHQFHRGNDQAPVVALARMCETFPNDAEWMQWYAAVALYAEYQKKTAEATAPYGVLPAYVYHEDEYLNAVDGDRYQSNREAFRVQVLNGMPMGDGYYLKAFPVWFSRRGNYGVLLAQTKALSAASGLRRDAAGADLVERQLQWVVGRNPFVQSTMWGEGYDFAQQYSVSSGDITGSLPVGMMTRGNRDLPYWPAQNGFVYKEVWVHPSARWLWIMADGVSAPERARGVEMRLEAPSGTGESVTIGMKVRGDGRHTFALRSDNLVVAQPERVVVLKAGAEETVTWAGKVKTAGAPWVAVVIPDGEVGHRREVMGRARH